MRIVLRLLCVGSVLLGGCSTEGTVAPSDDFIVVRAFVFAGEPVTDVRLTSAVPLGADTETAPPINDAIVTLIRSETRYTLIPSAGDSGFYHYPGDDLVIATGDRLRLEATYDGVTASGETVVPRPPVGVRISGTELQAPSGFGGGFIGGDGGFLDNSLTIAWDNDAREQYFITAENVELDPQPITRTGRDGTVITISPGRRFISRPTTADSYILRVFSVSHLGRHKVRVYRINQEYAELYVTQEQDSRDLNEPLTNIENGFGVFSAFNSDSVFFEVTP